MLFSEKPWYFSVVVDATLPFVVAGCCDHSVGLAWDWIIPVGIRKIPYAVTVNLELDRVNLEEVIACWNSTIWVTGGHRAFLNWTR